MRNPGIEMAEIPGGSIAGWNYQPDWDTEIVLTTRQLRSYMVVLRLLESDEIPEDQSIANRQDLRQWRKVQSGHPRMLEFGEEVPSYAVYSYYADGRFLKSIHRPDEKWVVKKNSMHYPV